MHNYAHIDTWPCSWSTPSVTTEWFELQVFFPKWSTFRCQMPRWTRTRFRSKVPPCRGSGRTKYRTPPFGGCWSAIWRNSWVIISFQTGVKSDRACSHISMFIIVHPCSEQKAVKCFRLGSSRVFCKDTGWFICLRSSMDRIKPVRNSFSIHKHFSVLINQDEENFPVENDGFPPLLCILESRFESIIAFTSELCRIPSHSPRRPHQLPRFHVSLLWEEAHLS